MTPKIPEDYFKLGAEAMRTEIVARLMILGAIDVAKTILSMPLPKFHEPEEFRIEGQR